MDLIVIFLDDYRISATFAVVHLINKQMRKEILTNIIVALAAILATYFFATSRDTIVIYTSSAMQHTIDSLQLENMRMINDMTLLDRRELGLLEDNDY